VSAGYTKRGCVYVCVRVKRLRVFVCVCVFACVRVRVCVAQMCVKRRRVRRASENAFEEKNAWKASQARQTVSTQNGRSD
jgi:hypothetical protein